MSLKALWWRKRLKSVVFGHLNCLNFNQLNFNYFCISVSSAWSYMNGKIFEWNLIWFWSTKPTEIPQKSFHFSLKFLGIFLISSNQENSTENFPFFREFYLILVAHVFWLVDKPRKFPRKLSPSSPQKWGLLVRKIPLSSGLSYLSMKISWKILHDFDSKRPLLTLKQYCVPSRVWTVPSVCSWKFLKNSR